jgi:fatty-acid desaturase
MHTNHHRYADTTKDHINFKRFWHDTLLLSPWMFITNTTAKFEMPDKQQYFAEQRAIYQSILDDLWTFFCEEYRIYLTLLFWFVMYLVCPIILFKVIFMGRFLISIFQFLAGVLGHTKLPFGYRNFNTVDSSYNNLIFHCLSLGLFSSMLHNNHHGMKKFGNGQVRWFEFDLSQYVIKIFNKLMIKV